MVVGLLSRSYRLTKLQRKFPILIRKEKKLLLVHVVSILLIKEISQNNYLLLSPYSI